MGWVAPQDRFTSSYDIVEYIALLLMQRGNDGEHALGKGFCRKFSSEGFLAMLLHGQCGGGGGMIDFLMLPDFVVTSVSPRLRKQPRDYATNWRDSESH